MVPVLSREVEEGEQSVPVLRQTSNRLLVLGAVFVGKHVDRRLGRRTGRRAVNLTKVCLHVDLDREGDLVEHVGSLVNPTPLVLGAREDLLDRLPEAERAIADREVRRDLETTLLDVDEKFTPALRALEERRRPSGAALRRGRHWQVAAHGGAVGTPRRGTTYTLAVFLFAATYRQRALSDHRPDGACCRIFARRHADNGSERCFRMQLGWCCHT